METTLEVIELKNREIKDIPIDPRSPNSRHFGVYLTVSEAQEFIEKEYRVFGDDEGPYLVIRLTADQKWPFVINKENVDVTFAPIRWNTTYMSGIICWLHHII